MKKMNRILRNQEGFTLIEIISVLVILGILAAVAVPKYLNMQAQAQTAAVQAALGAASSNVLLTYSFSVASGCTPPVTFSGGSWTCGAMNATTAGTNATPSTAVGDFSVSYAANGTNAVTITVTNSTQSWFGSYNGITSKTIVLQ